MKGRRKGNDVLGLNVNPDDMLLCCAFIFFGLFVLKNIILKNNFKIQNCLDQKVDFTQAANSKGKSLSPVLVERMCFCIKVFRYGRKQTHVHTLFEIGIVYD